jgi:DNA-binding MarR family transcriptional regulator
MKKYEYYIRAIAYGMRYANDQNLVTHGITNQQAQLLGDINDKLKKRSEVSRKSLSEVMGLSGPSITSLLNGLEKNGFIIRQQGDADGRTMRIDITEKAVGLIDETENVFAKTEQKLLEDFTDEQKKIFFEMLQKAHKNISINPE